MMPYINKSFFLQKKAFFTIETYHLSQTGYPPQNPCQIDDLSDVKKQNGVYFDYSFDIDSLNPSLSTDLETGIFCLTRGIRSVQG